MPCRPSFSSGFDGTSDQDAAMEAADPRGSESDGTWEELRLLKPREVRHLIWEQVPLVDASSSQEYLRHHLPGALHLPHGARLQQLRNVLPDLSQPLILYSNAQNRAAALARRLSNLDYANVYVLGGGIGILLALQDA
ncbi:MAG: hypothetical protein ER33_06275 [Cyanobium sp. CACIAM 14]|nr:MAG: hypothetical protein ER33_06275 [Cyanobium sp. CACIAM 14]